MLRVRLHWDCCLEMLPALCVPNASLTNNHEQQRTLAHVRAGGLHNLGGR